MKAQSDQQLGAFSAKISNQARRVKVEQAAAQPLGLTVDNAENFHLFSLGQTDENHEW
jgi:hypothetical protein